MMYDVERLHARAGIHRKARLNRGTEKSQA